MDPSRRGRDDHRVHGQGRTRTGNLDGDRAHRRRRAGCRHEQNRGRYRRHGGDTGRGMTAGSLSIEHSGSAVRLAAATARSMMIERAAGELERSRPPRGSRRHDHRSVLGRSTTYWKLQGGVPFDHRSRYTPAGTARHGAGRSRRDTSRVDLPAKVSGQPSYVHDLRFENMAHARVVRPPHYAARLRRARRVGGCGNAWSCGRRARRQLSSAWSPNVRSRQKPRQFDWPKTPAGKGNRTFPSRPSTLLSAPTVDYCVVDGHPVEHEVDSPSRNDDGSFGLSARVHQSLHDAWFARPVDRGGPVRRRHAHRLVAPRREYFPFSSRWPKCSEYPRRTSGSRTPRGRGVTGTTAPTTFARRRPSCASSSGTPGVARVDPCR